MLHDDAHYVNIASEISHYYPARAYAARGNAIGLGVGMYVFVYKIFFESYVT